MTAPVNPLPRELAYAPCRTPLPSCRDGAWLRSEPLSQLHGYDPPEQWL